MERITTFLSLIGCIQAIWVPPQPKTNVWVTLANLTGQDFICLSIVSPGNPFSTCLVGVLADTWPNTIQSQHLCSSFNACVDNWDGWSAHLPQLPQEPQELGLLDSVKMDSCLYFNYSGRNRMTAQNINLSLSIYRNNTAWCNYTSPNISKSSNAPLALPSGIFFICGDRAWGGIPSHIKGGPCSLGRFTLLTPNTSIMLITGAPSDRPMPLRQSAGMMWNFGTVKR